MSQDTTILFCCCDQADMLPAETKAAVLERLNAAGVTFETVPDLCGLIARRDPSLARYAQADNLRIAACFPRAREMALQSRRSPTGQQRASPEHANPVA